MEGLTEAWAHILVTLAAAESVSTARTTSASAESTARIIQVPPPDIVRTMKLEILNVSSKPSVQMKASLHERPLFRHFHVTLAGMITRRFAASTSSSSRILAPERVQCVASKSKYDRTAFMPTTLDVMG